MKYQRKSKIALLTGHLTVLFVVNPALSYEVLSHQMISSDAINRSVLGDPATLKRIGLFSGLSGGDTWMSSHR